MVQDGDANGRENPTTCAAASCRTIRMVTVAVGPIESDRIHQSPGDDPGVVVGSLAGQVVGLLGVIGLAGLGAAVSADDSISHSIALP